MEIPDGNGEVAHYYSELICVEYQKPYCWLDFKDGSKYKAEITIRQLLENLPGKAFYQCNRQSIINICHYRKYTENPPSVTMDNGKEFKISARNMLGFKKRKSGLTRISPPCKRCHTCGREDCPDYMIFCRWDIPS
ncbi:MAG: LytTR family transcriptional regulator [Bacteroidales bacterium]|nr:LytTR family transcriptional regulator [Bacteroidales bacterium]